MMFRAESTVLASVPPRSFASLMELYETNYIYMRRLVPGLRAMESRAISRPEDGLDLHLEVIEHSPYTSTVRLTHVFHREEEERPLPNIRVRVYHDARTAEVLYEPGLEDFAKMRPEPRPTPGSLSWKWELNRFLNRWLRYCLGEGHHFVAPAGEV